LSEKVVEYDSIFGSKKLLEPVQSGDFLFNDDTPSRYRSSQLCFHVGLWLCHTDHE
jgi:hypothetical protein